MTLAGEGPPWHAQGPSCRYVFLVAYSSPSYPPMYPPAVLRANGQALNALMVNRVGGEDSERIVSILATWK